MIERYRHELKYLCSAVQAEMIKYRLIPLLHKDTHTNTNGHYIIRSVYFDDAYRSCYYDNEDGVDPRHKYRVRIYNGNKGRISLEKKVKKNGMTGKESCIIDEAVFRHMVSDDDCIQYIGKNNLLDEWIMEKNRKLLRPVVIVEYKREPYIYNLGNVRITFDSEINGLSDIERFFDQSNNGIYVLPSEYLVLEVKYDEFLPDIVYELCDFGHLEQTTFSKFYLCCKALEGNRYVI